MLSQHQIKGSFSPATEFKATMLYHLSAGQSKRMRAYGAVNPQWRDANRSSRRLRPAGMYRLVYALPQSEHNFEFIYNPVTEDLCRLILRMRQRG